MALIMMKVLMSLGKSDEIAFKWKWKGNSFLISVFHLESNVRVKRDRERKRAKKERNDPLWRKAGKDWENKMPNVWMCIKMDFQITLFFFYLFTLGSLLRQNLTSQKDEVTGYPHLILSPCGLIFHIQSLYINRWNIYNN